MKAAEEKSPFKFLDSFTAADGEVFFGREPEVEEVYAKVFQSKILLVYGASGTGKSSIVNCGLANKFDEADWLPINIRRGGNILESMAGQINKLNLSSPLQNPEKAISPEDMRAALSTIFLDHFKPIYLVFDQFEELFIFGMRKEWKQFIEAISYLLNTDLELHFIFVVRGEYLEFIAEFEEMIPGFFNNRVRVEKMTRMHARDSILGPCEAANIKVEEGFENELLDKLSPGQNRVELTFLQVFLDKLYRQARQRTPEGQPVSFTKAEIEKLGQIGDVLSEFVDEQIFKMDDPKKALAVLKCFVSLEGTKLPLTLQEVSRTVNNRDWQLDEGEVAAIIQSFVNKRILQDQDDDGRFELRHDSLAYKIFEKISLQERERMEIQQFLKLSLNEYQKRGLLLSEEDIEYITPHLRRLSLDPEMEEFVALSRKRSSRQQQQRRNRRIISAVIIFLAIAATAGFFYSQKQRARANEMATRALSESEEARRQKENAEIQKENAEKSSKLAKEQEGIAIEQASIANEERQKAEEQKNLAISAQQRADKEKLSALEAFERAEESEAKAREQALLAQQEKQRAEHLRILGLSRELAFQSIRYQDPELKSQLALLSYSFNKSENGSEKQAEIYRALSEAIKSKDGNGHFEIYKAASAISDISFVNGEAWMISQNGQIEAVSAQSGKVIKSFTTKEFWECLAVSGKMPVLVAGSRSGLISYYNISDNSLKWSRSYYRDPVTGVIMTGNDKILVLYKTGKLVVTDLKGAVTAEHSVPVNALQITIHSGSGRIFGLSQGKVWTYDPALNKVEDLNINIPESITYITLHPNQTWLALGADKGGIHIMDFQTSEYLFELQGHSSSVSGMAFSPDGKSLASGSFDRSVRIWQMDDHKSVPLPIDNMPEWVSGVAFESNDQLWVSGYGGRLYKYPTDSKFLVQTLCNHGVQALGEGEWKEYVASDVEPVNPCEFDD